MKHWKIAGLVSVTVVCASAIFALDNGIYVGSNFYISGATCCPDQDTTIKHCKYVFITGVSEIPAGNGIRVTPWARKRNEDLLAGIWSEPKPAPTDVGFCRIFGTGQASSQFLTR